MAGDTQNVKPLYLYVVVVWLLLVLLSAAVIIDVSISRAKQDFEAKSLELYHMANAQVAINETVLDGFAATVNAMGRLDREKIYNYASQILARYPHIFMFEIAEKVAQRDEPRFEARMRREVYANFSIREFGYDTDRRWHPAGRKPFYLPITFMAPFPPDSRKVLGLDLNSNSIFIQSLKQSGKMHATVATRPFKLVEGKQAYLIHRPVKDRSDKQPRDGVEDRYVMLVILAKSLFGRSLQRMPAYGVTLYYNADTRNDSNGILYQRTLVQPGEYASYWLPRLSFTLPLTSRSQPFVLSVQQQLGWGMLDWNLLALLLFAAGVTFYLVIRYAWIYHREQIIRAEETNLLFYLANHDSLTGLANRNLLLDRLEHALKQARRMASRLAVLFIDLDEFKRINDSYGHAAGDLLLMEVAERLRKCVRSGDTLARRSGDEFVVILENISDRALADQVVAKFQQSIGEVFEIDGHRVSITASVGIALYPDDATEAEELLRVADRRMYSEK